MPLFARGTSPLYAFLVAHVVSSVGNGFAAVALPWFVLQTTGSVAKTGVAAAAGLVPQFISGIFGGVLVDRLGPKRMAIVSDAVSAVSVAAIPLLHATVGLSFGTLLLLIVLGALLDVPGASARRSLVPGLADAGRVSRERANAAFEVAYSITDLLGPVLAGILISAAGAGAALWADGASFVASAAVVSWSVPLAVAGAPELPSPVAGGPVRAYVSDVRTGLSFLVAEPAVRLIAFGFLLANIVALPLFSVVLPAYADRQPGGEFSLGALATAAGGGTLVGVLVYGWRNQSVPRRWWWIAGFLVSPLSYWLMAAGTDAVVVGAGLFAARSVAAGMQPMSVTVRQERIPTALRGRVFAASSAVAVLAAPIGTTGAGLLIDHIGLQLAVFLMAAAYQVLGVAMLFVPAVRQLDAHRPAVGVTLRTDETPGCAQPNSAPPR